MNRIFLLFICIILSCTIIEPSRLIIKNESDYDIKIKLNNGDKNEIIIKKGKGDLVLIYPCELKLEIEIVELEIIELYNLKINYLENKKFIFSTNNIE